MIRNQWYVILESKEVKAGKMTGVTRLGEKLVLWRDRQGKVVCMHDRCPHRGVALTAGKLLGEHLQCPFHGFEYDNSGACVCIPANGVAAPLPKAMRVPTYPTYEGNGFIYIWWGEPRESYPPTPWIEDIDESFRYATLRDLWKTHYSRAIENQLDVVHLPFVHHSTIGRGNNTVVEGPYFERNAEGEERNWLKIWPSNRQEDGTLPPSPRQMPRPEGAELLTFIFPNLWQNRLGDNLRIVIAFVPIDEENTMMYIREYQKIVKVTVFLQIFNLLGMLGNFVIERQDRRVVITQQPYRSSLDMSEKLIPGDGPVIAYRRKREELINRGRESAK
jgi:phenylpropionate dioxygenase-like ring-hydroxylating dioxygenase large terminal subunit